MKALAPLQAARRHEALMGWLEYSDPKLWARSKWRISKLPHTWPGPASVRARRAAVGIVA